MSADNPNRNPLADFLTHLQASVNNHSTSPNTQSHYDNNENIINPLMDWQDNPWVQWATRQASIGTQGAPIDGSARRRGRGRPGPPSFRGPPPHGWPFGPHPRDEPPPPPDAPAPPPHSPHGHHPHPHPPHPPHGSHPAPPPPPPPPGPPHHAHAHRPHHHIPGGPPHQRGQQTWDSDNDHLGGPPAWLNDLAEFITTQLGITDASDNTPRNDNAEAKAPASTFHDFVPEVDVFDTEGSYVVHFSLAGAKKEDINVNWDVEKNELVVGGVIYRPGDEDFLKTLALDERKIGAFERKVKLGGANSPAMIEVEGISAKMEDGVLRVTLPKQEKDDFVEVHHVDVD